MAEAVDILISVGAVLTDGHFVGTSGRHMPVYINKDALYSHPVESSKIGELFAEKYKNADIDVVAAPALGGIILSQWTAYHLTKLKGREVQGVYTEKTHDKNQVFTRGYDKLVNGKKVLIIEDLTTTGGSVKKVVDSVRAAGGEAVGVCVMVNRDPNLVTSESVGAPFDSLDVLIVESWNAQECPLCRKNIPVNTSVGHGRKFVEAMKKN
jgi:orotate phosphoribosyltransferase